MDKQINSTSRIGGTIRVPGDKSISHRALILGAMCRGKAAIFNLSPAADCAATMACLRELGVVFDNRADGTVIVNGQGRFGFREPLGVLDAGNSGTTMRLLAGLLSGQPFFSVITGDRSLCGRPMRRIIDPLGRMGAQINARNNGAEPPLAITGGSLTPIEYTMPVASAQVKSAILIAGLLCEGATTVVEKTPSRDHTERMLRYLDAGIAVDDGSITVSGGDLGAKEIIIPGDISSAFYILLAAALVGGPGVRVLNVGLNPTRLGGIAVLRKMGADIRVSEGGTCNGEPYGEIEAHRSKLYAVNITPEMIPCLVDEIPALALAATQAEGKTIFSGAQELRRKESDRLKGIADGLNRMGAAIIEKNDGLEINGPTPLQGATVASDHDHRLAMTLAIAGLIAGGETVIRDADSVAVSYPGFFEALDDITA